jgi:2-oxoisovalerate dehydrogenase E1 component alpha subunit
MGITIANGDVWYTLWLAALGCTGAVRKFNRRVTGDVHAAQGCGSINDDFHRTREGGTAMSALRPNQFVTHDYAGDLSNDQLLAMLENMMLSRKLDERMWVLNRQGKVPFHISAMGHEACQVGMAFAMRPGYDWLHPYYRDIAFNLALGATPTDLMLPLFGKAEDPSSGGRQMPAHFGNSKLRIVSGSSPVTTQVPQAAGIALAAKLRQLDEVVVTTFGEGSTSQGDFHEGLNWAGIHKLAVIFLCQNNQYAISVPMSKQMAVENVADRGAAYGMPGVIYDGNDVLEAYNVSAEAVARARRGDGPSLLEAKTYRPVPHSSDDDDRSYRSREEVEEWKHKDPIQRFEKILLARGVLTTAMRDEIAARVGAQVDAATEYAMAAAYPKPEDALFPVFGKM